MKLSARISKIINEEKLKAIATVCIDGEFLVTGIRVYDTKKSLFIAMPSRKTQNGEYRNICFPLNKELREAIASEVRAAYHDESEAIR